MSLLALFSTTVMRLFALLLEFVEVAESQLQVWSIALS